MRKILATLTLSLILTGSAAAYDVNIDFKNTGTQDAYDIALVLEGDENISARFDGYWDIRFHTFKRTSNGSQTVLHWEHPWDQSTNTPTRIKPGDICHVGYSTTDRNSVLKDAYWTDQDGSRILGSKIAVAKVDPHPTGVTFVNRLPVPIVVRDIRYTTRVAALPLEALNMRNAELMSTLQPLPGPAGIVLQPEQGMTLPFPSPVPPGQAAIVVCTVDSPEGSDAEAIHFVQDIVE